MQIVVNESTVVLEGVLTENLVSDELRSMLLAARGASEDKFVRANFGKVQRANSCGLLTWLRLCSDLELSVIYVDAPVWLTEQFNSIDEFFYRESYCESLIIPFYCATSDEHVMRIMKIGKDIPILNDYAEFKLSFNDETGRVFEADVIESEFFYFLTTDEK